MSPVHSPAFTSAAPLSSTTTTGLPAPPNRPSAPVAFTPASLGADAPVGDEPVDSVTAEAAAPALIIIAVPAAAAAAAAAVDDVVVPSGSVISMGAAMAFQVARCFGARFRATSDGSRSRVRSRRPHVLASAARVAPPTLDAATNTLRKLLGTMEKYRINDPARIARAYAEMIEAALRAGPKDWLSAMSALQYYGLLIENFVHPPPPDAKLGTRHILDVAALEYAVATDLLDMTLDSEASTDSKRTIPPLEEQHFQQLQTTNSTESLALVRRMIAGVVRVALRYAILRERLQQSNSAEAEGQNLHCQLAQSPSGVLAQIAMDADTLLDISQMDFNTDAEFHQRPAGKGPRVWVSLSCEGLERWVQTHTHEQEC